MKAFKSPLRGDSNRSSALFRTHDLELVYRIHIILSVEGCDGCYMLRARARRVQGVSEVFGEAA